MPTLVIEKFLAKISWIYVKGCNTLSLARITSNDAPYIIKSIEICMIKVIRSQMVRGIDVYPPGAERRAAINGCACTWRTIERVLCGEGAAIRNCAQLDDGQDLSSIRTIACTQDKEISFLQNTGIIKSFVRNSAQSNRQLDGNDLDHRVPETPLPLPLAIVIVIQCCTPTHQSVSDRRRERICTISSSIC
ncbi:hypothetical protein RR46_01406 [Papilio xuthus]|uniref:Uncharacterized protein n=1 Tax=Papilio xuthus TaxID=66420 RepID=A0A0N1IBD3_PAPXU|nr:hypothetical protein RR46_01406 [Papilio xuthus]